MIPASYSAASGPRAAQQLPRRSARDRGRRQRGGARLPGIAEPSQHSPEDPRERGPLLELATGEARLAHPTTVTIRPGRRLAYPYLTTRLKHVIVRPGSVPNKVRRLDPSCLVLALPPCLVSYLPWISL